ncbi:MAG: hypothetical protein WA655_24745 [Candidatus Korobacteraceae bacterium]
MVALPAIVLLGSAMAAAGTVYENGPQNIHENLGAWAFYGNRYVVSNTFPVTGSTATITGISIWMWGWPTDHNPTAEVVITSQPNGGTIYFDQVLQFTESNCYADGFGFSHCQETASWANGPALPSGVYWVNLKNGSVPSGNEFFWDANAGAGCQSAGCPSQAEFLSTLGESTIPSEAFTLMGTSGGSHASTAPKTTSLLLFGAGFVGLVGMVRRKVG